MKIYQISRGQLITIWCFGLLLCLTSLIQLSEEESAIWMFLLIATIPALTFYTLGWRNAHITQPPKTNVKSHNTHAVSLPKEVRAAPLIHQSVDPAEQNRLHASFRRKMYFAAFFPTLFIFLLAALWGVINLLSTTFGNFANAAEVVSMLIPILFALGLLAIPIGIALAMYYHRKAGEVTLTSYDERSGQGSNSTIPIKIKKWSWGAFGLGILWGMRFGVWQSFLLFIPIVNLVYPFVLGAKGNEWAWQNSKWQNIDEFKKSSKRWNIAGAIALVIYVPLIFLGTIFNETSQTSATVSDAQSELTASDTSQGTDIDFQPDKYKLEPYTIEQVSLIAQAGREGITFPQKINDDTYMLSIDAEGYNLIYKYKITDEATASSLANAKEGTKKLVAEAMKSELIKTACSKGDAKGMMDRGVVLVFKYYDAKMKPLADVLLSKSDCP